MRTLDFSDSTVLISGTASGIGRSLARAFAEHGARLELSDRNGEALAQVTQELSNLTAVSGCCVDLTDDVAVSRYASSLAERCDRLDVLINNAGMELPTPLDDGAAITGQALVVSRGEVMH